MQKIGSYGNYCQTHDVVCGLDGFFEMRHMLLANCTHAMQKYAFLPPCHLKTVRKAVLAGYWNRPIVPIIITSHC